MKHVMERQLSWIAILMTAFYSLLASCRAEKCDHEELTKCARPLEKITKSNELGFVSNKAELEELCPDLESGTKCIKEYTSRCLNQQQRGHFHSMYSGINEAIRELCHDGPAQDEFLKHAPCMQTVKEEYELCSKRNQATLLAIKNGNATTPGGPVKSICCAFQEYLECSNHAVRRQCGEETAEYTKKFLDRMSNSLIKLHCQPYANGQCIPGSGSERLTGHVIVPVMLLAIGRYFT